MLIPIAHAAVSATQLGNVIDPILNVIVYPIIKLLLGIAVVVFVWGIIKMIRDAEDAEARKTARIHMLYGIIGFVIMLSAWAIIAVIANTVKGFQ